MTITNSGYSPSQYPAAAPAQKQIEEQQTALTRQESKQMESDSAQQQQARTQAHERSQEVRETQRTRENVAAVTGLGGQLDISA